MPQPNNYHASIHTADEFLQKQQGKLERLTNTTFQFEQRFGIGIQAGRYSAVYFDKTAQIAQAYRPNTQVTMQFFQRQQAVLCGVDEAIALVHTFAHKPQTLEIKALHDGDSIEPFEPVLSITGEYQKFGFLEGMIDGILARRTSVATNVTKAVAAANGKPVIFMGDRDDHFGQQAGDGYAAFIGGSTAQATPAMTEWWGGQAMGTMPHALIQLFGGDLLAACHAYRAQFPHEKLVALVDYHNDVIGDALKVAAEFGEQLSGVRVDTSGQMVDAYFSQHPEAGHMGQVDPRGVNVTLIKALRHALDQAGHSKVQIIASGGFTADKIKDFEQQNAPVDAYGVGSSLIKVTLGFTGDCVLLDGKPQAKVGRHYTPSARLQPVTYNI